MLTLKNNTESIKLWGGKEYAASEEYNLQRVDHDKLLDDFIFMDDLYDGYAVLNDGYSIVSSDTAELILKNQIRVVHDSLIMYHGVGIQAPALFEIDRIIAGDMFCIGDILYGYTKLEGMIDADFKICMTFIINNDEINKWIRFEFAMVFTSGEDNTIFTIPQVIVQLDALEVPDTPFRIFKQVVILPSELLDISKRYIFGSIKRIEVESLQKSNPINDPVLIGFDKIHRQKLEY